MGTVKYTGPVASFHCPTNAEIRSLKVHFSPKQEGSGDPSPENVRPIEGWDGVEQYYSRKNIGHIVGYSASATVNRVKTNSYGTTINTINYEGVHGEVVVTQSQAPKSEDPSHYQNGYIVFYPDNLIWDQRYDFSFRVNNIISNPLNATLNNLKLINPYGNQTTATEVIGDRVYFKNMLNKQKLNTPNLIGFDIRICGMSCTISDIMITSANTNDQVYEPYTQKRIVKWNQWLPALNDENWQAYNSNYINTTFENGVATSTWLTNNSGYQASVRTKKGVLQKNKEIWYLSYMLKTSMSGGSWGAEFNGGLQNTSVYNLEADVWTRCSECSIYWRGTRNYTYISYYRAGIDEHTGMVAQVKSPIFINLTQMFGAGNEPSKEEFEEQCALNGIDLTSTLPYDEGSIKEWKTNGALLKNSIIFPVLGKNKFNINTPFAEPSNTSSSSSVARIFQPYTYCLGLSVGNSYLPDRITDFSISNNTLTFSTINTSYGIGFAIPLQPGSYRMTYTGENITRTLVCYNNEGDTVSTNIDSQGIFYISPNVSIAVIIFRSSTANTPTTVSNIQIEEGITSTEYEEFNPNHTVYGGWVDLITGEVQEEWIYAECNDKTLWEEMTNNTCDFLYTYPFTGRKRFDTSYQGLVSSSFLIDNTKNAYMRWVGTGSDKVGIRNRTTSYTLTDIQQMAENGDISICYQIATPNTYYLTPTQLQTFLGQNNIWSNTDYVEVEYDLHETQNILARKQFIIANQPHVVKPAAAPLQNFVTDIAAPLKECKVHFAPVQDLHDYDKPWVGGSGKNLFNPNCEMWDYSVYTKDGNNITQSGSDDREWTNTNFIPLHLAAGTYTISCSDGNNFSYATSLDEFTIPTTLTSGGGTFTLSEDCDIKIKHSVKSGNSYPTTFTVQLEKGSTATTYEPWENVCPIEGWEKIQIGLPSEYTRVEYIGTGNDIPYIDTGIYLTDELETEIHYYNDKLEAYLFGARASNSNPPFCNFNIEATYNRSRLDYGNRKGTQDATRYNNMHDGEFQFTFHNRIGTLTDLTLSISKEVTYDRETFVFRPFTTNTLLLFAVYNSANSTILTSNKLGDLNIYSAKFWIGGKLVRNFIPCIRKSDNKVGMYDTVSKSFFTSQNSSEFISGAKLEEHSLLIDWSDSTGIVYGGYVDLVTGEVVQEWEIVSGRWGDIKTGSPNNTTGYYLGRLNFNNKIVVLHSESDYGINTISNIIPKVKWNTGEVAPEHYFGGNTNDKGSVFIYGNYDDNLIIQIAAKLATSIHYSLTPEILKTFRGTNNLWSNSNDNIEIAYWKH